MKDPMTIFREMSMLDDKEQMINYLQNLERGPLDEEEKKPQTNADRIRAMSDEELAWELMTWRIEAEAKHHGIESNYPNTKSAILEWLKQPAEVDNG